MIILFSTLISLLASYLSYICKTDFLHIFLTKDAIIIIGVMLSMNCVLVSNLHLKLVEQEEKIKEEAYINTKKEIKENIIFSIVSFLFAIVLLFVEAIVNHPIANYIIDSIILTIFLLHIYAVHEITVRFTLKIKPLV